MADIARVFAEVLLPILLTVAFGYLFRRKISFDLPSINRLCMYLLSPCLVFNTLLRANLNGGDTVRMIAFVIISWAIIWLGNGRRDATVERRPGF